ncbi:uridine kinase [Comamonadaceae bacterium OS-1]|nr:uridine kinase [Comamonadaceae bacterium OS-1]
MNKAPHKPFVIGVAGGSGSGKSTVTRQVLASIGPEMMSLKIFVDTAADVRFIRRLQRDMAERGRSAESVITQYLETVRPMHKQFIEPTKRRADVILPHGANGPAIDIITTKVVSLVRDLDRV